MTETPRTVAETSVTMAQVMQPEDANPAGNVHGGVIMKLIDTAAAVAASRHARMNTVTASIDSLHFHSPVFVGDLLFLKASLNMASRSSMEIGVRVEAECRRGREATARRQARLDQRARTRQSRQ